MFKVIFRYKKYPDFVMKFNYLAEAKKQIERYKKDVRYLFLPFKENLILENNNQISYEFLDENDKVIKLRNQILVEE